MLPLGNIVETKDCDGFKEEMFSKFLESWNSIMQYAYSRLDINVPIIFANMFILKNRIIWRRGIHWILLFHRMQFYKRIQNIELYSKTTKQVHKKTILVKKVHNNKTIVLLRAFCVFLSYRFIFMMVLNSKG